jgi:hypothetical protein
MKPVTQADVVLNGRTFKTDNKGEAVFHNVPVGEYKLKTTKKYYKETDSTYVVPILRSPDDKDIHLVATGRQVMVSVVNKITQAALAKAIVTVQGTSATTDSKGMAILVLPTGQKALKGTISLDGYNRTDAEISISEQANINKFSLTPSGTVFYLSKQTGKINVMKSNLDGSDPHVVVEGTGSEIDRSTVMLAARDWKYMALSAKRDNDQVGQLYLIDAKSGKLTTIDQGDADFQLVGWSNHRFIYLVNRNHKNNWDDKRQSLKSFNAETGQITTLDESSANGTNEYDAQAETIQTPYILEGKVVYAKAWWSPNNILTTDKKSAIMAVNPDGSQKQRTKEFAMQRYIGIEAKLYEPQGIYYKVSTDGDSTSYYEYESGAVRSIPDMGEKFYNTFYPTYLISPNSKATFWYEPRDGKNALLVGDKDGKNSKELANQSDYTAYGWYGDDYVLLSKGGSELYIASADKTSSDNQPLKITNYHKPSIDFPGYGYGYGGQ